MDFLSLRPLSPKTGYHFFEGVGVGVKSFRSEGSKQWGSLPLSHNRRSNGNAAGANFLVGASILTQFDQFSSIFFSSVNLN